MFVKNDEVLFLFRLNSFCFCVILKICKTFLKNIHDEVFKFFSNKLSWRQLRAVLAVVYS